jgi:hypothetical protein
MTAFPAGTSAELPTVAITTGESCALEFNANDKTRKIKQACHPKRHLK